jgi:NADH:quinone reductase (non-electrogenic)
MAYHERMSNQKILIVGGGFGGIKAALELSKGDNSKFDITLVSDQVNFRYYPALYRTATGGVAAGSSISLMSILSDPKVKIIQGTAETIDRRAHALMLAGGEVLDYDVIIFGLGVVTNYFGIPGMEDFSYSIKSFDAIKRFKEHLHKQIEDERRPDLNYVIVGAGPTGIELAGGVAGVPAQGDGDTRRQTEAGVHRPHRSCAPPAATYATGRLTKCREAAAP